jgi:hypothetical protein
MLMFGVWVRIMFIINIFSDSCMINIYSVYCSILRLHKGGINERVEMIL